MASPPMLADVRHRRCWSSVRVADRRACEVAHASGSVRPSALAPGWWPGAVLQSMLASIESVS
ncbi:hypothetical protein VC153_26365 [Escherichia coli]|uniref:hypothetical protein n=1 Tax=Escherichia coli TaxID=562 RepID=UPI002B22EBDB|nr:hypothetical protein [Escherichia coli]MEA9550244.1 hypothetical protein [Escherichia coli]